jgi:hypothetical protein
MARSCFAALAVLALVACKGSGSSSSSTGGPGSSKLARLDLTGAKLVFVSGGNNGQALVAGTAAGAEPRLYKITDGGQVLEVTQTCESSSPDVGADAGVEEACTTAYTPVGVLAAGRDYLYVWYTSGDRVLVRKSDGRAFLANAIGSPMTTTATGPLGQPVFRTDGAGNLYFLAGGAGSPGGSIVKIDVTDPAHLTATNMTAQTDTAADTFLVDADGNVLYATMSVAGCRVRMPTGSFMDYSCIGSAAAEWPWNGPDGFLYAVRRSSSPTMNAQGDIVRLGFANGALSLTPTTTWSTTYELSWALGGPHVAMGTTLYFVGGGGPAQASVVIELQSVTSPPTFYPLPAEAGALGGASSSALWFYGKNSAGVPAFFKRWTPAGMTDVLAPGTYDIISSSVTSDDVATFTALRLSDGVKVLGKVDAAGTLTILDSGTAAQTVTLVPLN